MVSVGGRYEKFEKLPVPQLQHTIPFYIGPRELLGPPPTTLNCLAVDTRSRRAFHITWRGEAYFVSALVRRNSVGS